MRFGVAQPVVMGDAARRLQRESEMVGYLFRPLRKHRLCRHTVESVVDLDRRKTLGVVAQHLAHGEFLRIEMTQPFLVGVAARSRAQQHRLCSYNFRTAIHLADSLPSARSKLHWKAQTGPATLLICRSGRPRYLWPRVRTCRGLTLCATLSPAVKRFFSARIRHHVSQYSPMSRRRPIRRRIGDARRPRRAEL